MCKPFATKPASVGTIFLGTNKPHVDAGKDPTIIIVGSLMQVIYANHVAVWVQTAPVYIHRAEAHPASGLKLLITMEFSCFCAVFRPRLSVRRND